MNDQERLDKSCDTLEELLYLVDNSSLEDWGKYYPQEVYPFRYQFYLGILKRFCIVAYGSNYTRERVSKDTSCKSKLPITSEGYYKQGVATGKDLAIGVLKKGYYLTLDENSSLILNKVYVHAPQTVNLIGDTRPW